MAAGIELVAFPYGEYNGDTPVVPTRPNYGFKRPTERIGYPSTSTVRENVAVARVGYSSALQKYTVVLGGIGKPRDDANTVFFLDDSAIGRDTPVSILASECIGVEVYATKGLQGRDGKAAMGIYPSQVHAASVDYKFVVDGEPSTQKVFTAGTTRSSGSYLYTYSSTIYHVGLPESEFYFYPPSSVPNYRIDSVSGTSGESSGSNPRPFSWKIDGTADTEITWELSSRYSVKYEPNGGAGFAPQITNAYFSDGVKLSGNTYRRPGYVFAGWSLSSSAASADFADESSADAVFEAAGASAGDTITLYAVWRRPTVYIVNSDTNKGFLRLYLGTGEGAVTSANKKAEESGGVLAADVPDGDYTVVCENKDSLYAASGLSDDGETVLIQSTVDANGGAKIILNLEGAFEGSVLYEKRPTYTINVKVFEDGQEITPAEGDCDAVVTTAPDELGESGDEPRWLVGRAVTISGRPAAGFRFATAVVSGTQYTIAQNNFTIQSLSSDVTVNCYFERVKYVLAAEVDAPSSGAVQSVTVDDSATGRAEAYYGDTVTYKAVISSTTAQFAGWYDGDGNLVSAQNPYEHAVTGDATLVAKAKVSVTLGIEHYDNREDPEGELTESCSLTVGGEPYTAPFDVILGGSFGFALTLGALNLESEDRWSFDAWYAENDEEHDTPLAYGTSGTVTPTANMSIVARVSAEPIAKVLTVNLLNDEGYTSIGADDALTVYDELLDEYITPTVDDGEYVFSLVGSHPIRIQAAETVTVGGAELSFSGFAEKVSATEYRAVSASPQYDLFLTGGAQLYALYGAEGTRTIVLGYGTSGGIAGDPTMGTFAITETDDPDGEISEDGRTADIHRGRSITIVATPKNGYRFGGWFTSAEVGGTPYIDGTTAVRTVVTNRSLYAYFAQDPNAVYEWEGSDANKMMTWRSKVYVSPVPFNPSAIRVDATDSRGRGATVGRVEVGMMSSPDATPAQSGITVLQNMPNYTVRRLPKRRPERYLYVEVRNDAEVDRIIVGTSMEGLKV